MAVIKADGYGHGMEVAATALVDADEFAVSSLDDAMRLRQHGVAKPITLLSAMYGRSEFEMLGKLKVRPTLFDECQIDLIEQLDLQEPLSVWIKVDSGMGRLGFAPQQIADVWQRLQGAVSVAGISLMTHLANADDPGHELNRQQIAVFQQLTEQHEFVQLSALNSGGTIALGDFEQGQSFDVVRPGLMLYGASPLLSVSAHEIDLQPAMTFRSELISVKTLTGGSCVGYGSTTRLAKDTEVGIVACGYGDGYPRHAPPGTPVVVNGKAVPLIGRVSMDMLVVDLSGVGAEVGDEVILWGAANPIENIAKLAGTIAYELCCGITARVERIII